MDNSHTISGLMAKRAELVRTIKKAQAAFVQMTADLEAIDATIRLFDPSAHPARLNLLASPLKELAHRGEMSRMVLNGLRGARSPLTSLEVARMVMEARGMDLGDHKATIAFRKRASACLWNLQSKGLVRATDKLIGEYKGWELVR